MSDSDQGETVSAIFTYFTSGKAMVAAHYAQVAQQMPDAKMTVKDLRQDLIDTHYSEYHLRELAGAAEIQNKRIKSIQTLRDRLRDHFADQLPEQISARMRRRVALGAAMVGGRPLIVLDDVDLGLDAPTTARTVQAILTSQRRSGATMLITTHDIELAKALDGWLAVLANGRIVANGPTRELLAGVDDAEEFDRRFHVLDWMGPPMPEIERRGGRSRELTFDPQLVIMALIAFATILAFVLAMRATGGPLGP